MKSEGVKDIVEWMKQEIKAKQQDIKDYPGFNDYGVMHAELAQMVKWKISTEKYMKKLKHQGE